MEKLLRAVRKKLFSGYHPSGDCVPSLFSVSIFTANAILKKVTLFVLKVIDHFNTSNKGLLLKSNDRWQGSPSVNGRQSINYYVYIRNDVKINLLDCLRNINGYKNRKEIRRNWKYLIYNTLTTTCLNCDIFLEKNTVKINIKKRILDGISNNIVLDILASLRHKIALFVDNPYIVCKSNWGFVF